MQPEVIDLYEKNRASRWIQTYSGVQFYPEVVADTDFNIRDIAHSLGKLCRFNGHCLTFYSVAEHSVHVSRNVPDEYALWGLLHDAAEAYLGDMCRPVKPLFEGYKAIEINIMNMIARGFGLDPTEEPEIVKRIDNAILADEQQQIMSDPPANWFLPEPPLGVTIEGWNWRRATGEFLMRFAELTG